MRRLIDLSEAAPKAFMSDAMGLAAICVLVLFALFLPGLV